MNYLLRSATINLKKNSGDGDADWSELYDFAKAYKDQLAEQISKISADIIYCAGYNGSQGSVFSITRDHVLTKFGKWEKVKEYEELTLYKCCDSGQFFIDGYHFDSRNLRYFDSILEDIYQISHDIK